MDCNGVTDADVDEAARSKLFKPTVVSDAGCFWQEDTGLGSIGPGWASRHGGTAAATWTPSGARTAGGRTLTELSIDGNKGFKASDDTACSIYVAKGGDVITWSIQTMNSATLPDLCSIIEQLAQLSQERVN